MTNPTEAVLTAALAWRDAVERYETECRRQHESYSAYPEASGRRRRDDDSYMHPAVDSVVAAAREARDAEAALRKAIAAWEEL